MKFVVLFTLLPYSLLLITCSDDQKIRHNEALAKPVTLNSTKAGGNKRLEYAVSAMRGYVDNMEDAVSISLTL